MEYRYLAGTGLEVSRACLGSMTFGGQLSETDAVRLTHYAFDKGVNFIDTANYYTNGSSEKIVGKAIKGIRNNILLATKVGWAGSPPHTGYNTKGLSRKHIIEQVNASLKNLGTDYIDIYYMHTPDRITPLDETLETFSTLVHSGKIRYVGVSNYAAWQVMEIIYKSELKNYVAPSVSQMVYNMITRGLEQEFIPFIKKYKLGLVVYNPLAGGFLSGKYTRGEPGENTRFTLFKQYMGRYWVDDNFSAIESLSKIASGVGISLTELAMRWCVSQDIVDSILIGFSKEDQLMQNIDIMEKEVSLDKNVIEECEKVWKKLSGTRFQYNE